MDDKARNETERKVVDKRTAMALEEIRSIQLKIQELSARKSVLEKSLGDCAGTPAQAKYAMSSFALYATGGHGIHKSHHSGADSLGADNSAIRS